MISSSVWNAASSSPRARWVFTAHFKWREPGCHATRVISSSRAVQPGEPLPIDEQPVLLLRVAGAWLPVDTVHDHGLLPVPEQHREYSCRVVPRLVGDRSFVEGRVCDCRLFGGHCRVAGDLDLELVSAEVCQSFHKLADFETFLGLMPVNFSSRRIDAAVSLALDVVLTDIWFTSLGCFAFSPCYSPVRRSGAKRFGVLPRKGAPQTPWRFQKRAGAPSKGSARWLDAGLMSVRLW